MHRADAHLFDARVDDHVGQLVGELVARLRDLLAVDLDVLGQDTAEQRGVDVAVLHDRAVGPAHVRDRRDGAVGLAVLLADDDLLGHVHEPAGQVARVRRPQRRVGQTLAGTVRGDEVLQHRQALAEVRPDRPRDDLALRVRHQATHPGELADLHDVPARARVGHHVDRVRRGELGLHGLLHLVGGLGPDLDQLLPALVVGDDPAAVLLLDLLGALLVLVQDLRLLRRGRDVLDADRHAGARGVVEAEVLEVVQDLLDLGAVVAGARPRPRTGRRRPPGRGRCGTRSPPAAPG